MNRCPNKYDPSDIAWNKDQEPSMTEPEPTISTGYDTESHGTEPTQSTGYDTESHGTEPTQSTTFDFEDRISLDWLEASDRRIDLGKLFEGTTSYDSRHFMAPREPFNSGRWFTFKNNLPGAGLQMPTGYEPATFDHAPRFLHLSELHESEPLFSQGLTADGLKEYLDRKCKGNPRKARAWLESLSSNPDFLLAFEVLAADIKDEIKAVFVARGQVHLARAIEDKTKPDDNRYFKSTDVEENEDLLTAEQAEEELKKMFENTKMYPSGGLYSPSELKKGIHRLKQAKAPAHTIAGFEIDLPDMLRIAAQGHLNLIIKSIENNYRVYDTFDLLKAMEEARTAGVLMTDYEKQLSALKAKIAQAKLDNLIEAILRGHVPYKPEDLADVMLAARNADVPMHEYDAQYPDLIDIMVADKKKLYEKLGLTNLL